MGLAIVKTSMASTRYRSCPDRAGDGRPARRVSAHNFTKKSGGRASTILMSSTPPGRLWHLRLAGALSKVCKIFAAPANPNGRSVMR